MKKIPFALAGVLLIVSGIAIGKCIKRRSYCKREI